MSQRVFIDTNIFIYADDDSAGEKQRRAKEVLKEPVSTGNAVISTQVLQEYFNIATKQLKLTAERARWRVESMSRYAVVLNDASIILGAIDLHRLNRISSWDALIIKAASAVHCKVVLTEDMNHGQVIDGVRIENPFLPSGRAAEPRARYHVMPEVQYFDAKRTFAQAEEPKAKRPSKSQRGSARAR